MKDTQQTLSFLSINNLTLDFLIININQRGKPLFVIYSNDLKLAKCNTYLENLMLESIAIVASFQKADF